MRLILFIICVLVFGCQEPKLYYPVEVSPGVVKMEEYKVEEQKLQLPKSIHLVIDSVDAHTFRGFGVEFMENICNDLRESKNFKSIKLTPDLKQLIVADKDYLIPRREKDIDDAYIYRFTFNSLTEKKYVGGSTLGYMIAGFLGAAVTPVCAGGLLAFPTMFLDKWRAAMGGSVELQVLKLGEDDPIFKKLYNNHLVLSIGILCSEDYKGRLQAWRTFQIQVRNQMYRDLKKVHGKS